MDYLKYLWFKPLTLLWIIAANVLLALAGVFFFKDITDIIGDNGVFVVIIICIIMTIILIAVTLQPYYEWKNGNRNNNN